MLENLEMPQNRTNSFSVLFPFLELDGKMGNPLTRAFWSIKRVLPRIPNKC